VEKAFDDATGLTPGKGLCLTFRTEDNNSAKLQYQDKDVVLPNAALSVGDDQFQWDTPVTDEALLFTIYGTETTPGPDQAAIRPFVTAVQVTVQSGDDVTSAVTSRTRTLNRPELLTGWWETDFSTTPTSDRNGDGQDDWIVRSSGTILGSELLGGILRTDSTLDTNPANDFTGLTAVEARMRGTKKNSDGATISINADSGGGMTAPLSVNSAVQSDGTQSLQLTGKDADGDDKALYTQTGLGTDLLDVRLLIDPDVDTVAIFIGGAHKGTYTYNRVATVGDERFATLTSAADDGEFDRVSIRVFE